MPEKNKKRILLVEDEAIIALNEKASLEKYGYDISIVNSGDDAVAYVDSNPFIDLIIMDIDLGDGMDGTQAAEKILQSHDLPVFFLSSHSEPEIVEKTEKITSYGYVVKDTGITVLDASIKMAFKLFAEKQQSREYEESLQKNQQILRKIIDAIPHSIFWKDTKGRYLGCNRLFARSVGYEKPNEIIGKTDYDLPWLKHDADAYRADDQEVITMNISKTHIIEPFRQADGSELIVDTSKHPLADETGKPFAVLGIAHDISDRIKAEEELRKKDSMLTNISSQVPGMLYQFMMKPDGSLSVPYSSQGVWDVFGCTPEQVRDDFSPIFNAIHPDDRPKILETIKESVKTMAQWKCEYRVQVPGRKIIWVYGNSIPEKLDDGSIIWSGYNVDITDRKLVELEMQRQLQEKQSLLREVHHRIKNNITSIENLLLMQLESVSNPEAVSILQDAVSRVKSMRMLYDSLLLGEEYRNVPVKEYFENLINTVSALFPEEREIFVNKEIDDFLLSSKKLFPLAIIVTELLTNAMKYAFRGRDSGAIDVSIVKRKQKIKLTMHDNGVGFPDGFDTSQPQGLGLMLVNMLSKQLGEDFVMENSNGARFVLEFEL